MFGIKVRVRVGDFLSFVTVAVDFDRNDRASFALVRLSVSHDDDDGNSCRVVGSFGG